MKRVISLLITAVMLLALLPVLPATEAKATASDTYEVSDYTDSAPHKDGYVFAGWYTDDTFATHYTAASGTATAKFVPEEVFGVKYQIRTDTDAGSENTRMRIVTTVDSLDYKSVGFIVQYEGEAARKLQTKTVYRRLIGYDGIVAFTYYPSESFHSESQYFCAYNFTVPKAKFDAGFTVTPIIQTIDGTEVQSAARTITVSEYPTFAPAAQVTGYKLEGTWGYDRVTSSPSASLAPDKAYDGDISTYWDPKATDFKSGEGIIFRLDRAYDLSKVILTFKTRALLLDLYTSPDCENWTKKATISSANYGDYYTTSTSGSTTYQICTIGGLSAADTGYVKISFTGSEPLSLFMSLCETAFYGRLDTLDTSALVSANVAITANEILGTWKTPRSNGNGDVGSANTYDGNVSTRWNPESNSKYTQGEGIAYTLAKKCSISGVKLTFTTYRYYHFDLLVSENGTDWTLARSIGAANRADFYSTVDSYYVCTINDLAVESAQYIKVLFTGSSVNASDEWVDFREFEITSWAEPDTRVPEAATIVSHEQSGSWSVSGATNKEADKSYDGDESTPWNAACTKDSSTIVYTLDKYYNLTEFTFEFSKEMYFDLYVSGDGSAWTQVASVTSSSGNYSGNTCTVTGQDTEDAKYVKIVFTSANGTWFNLYELYVTGKAVPDTRPEVAVTIAAHEFAGTWSTQQATNKEANKSYDGDAATMWNAAFSGTASSMIYTLDDTYNLTGAVLVFGDRELYFDLAVSSDGTTWIPVTSVTSTSGNYTDGTCTLSGLNTANAAYLKITFTGCSKATTWFNLYEITLTGKKSNGLTTTVSGVFSSHMVLQRGEPIAVWGWGPEGARVSGSFMGEEKSAAIGSNGTWRLTFSSREANTVGQTMTISSETADYTFTDILIGDVYIVNGQSNAQLALSRTAAHLDNEGREAVKALFRSDSGIRLFLQDKAYVTSNQEFCSSPQENVINPTWKWQVSNENDAFWNFSALGMYVARDLRQSVAADIPIGLIQTAAGGAFLDELSPNELNQQFGYTAKHAVVPGGYYNAMIHPFVGLPIKAMLFYQGESNSGLALAGNYARDLEAMVTELRSRWGYSFPFFNVQLSSHGQDLIDAHTWLALPQVRAAQCRAADAISDYYLAVSMDIGYRGEEDVGTGLRDFAHPKDKKTLGERVAKQIRKVCYGEVLSDEQAFSPVPTDVSFNGADGILITFSNVGSGLTLASGTGSTLLGFRCVVNNETVEVPATIVGTNQVKLDVNSANVVSAGYGLFQLAYPENANLCGSAGLPAAAFQIDNPGPVSYTKVFISGFETSAAGYSHMGSSGYTPESSYDGVEATYWNPCFTGFAAEPSITYELNAPADVSGMTLTFIYRRQYFTLYSSADGTNFTQCAQVTASNYADYYTDYICTLDNLSLSGARYLKFVFNGSSDGSLWVGFCELDLNASLTQ